MRKIPLIISCWMVTIVVLELAMQALSVVSYQMKFYTKNPYEQQFLDDIRDWKGISKISTCPQPPGSMLNGFVINSHGFLSPEYPYEKQNGVKRIVLLGDSFAVGAVPYPNNFIRILDRHLNQNDEGIKYEVINLGIPCIGPNVERKILEVEGVKYQPDLVILSFFVGNDLTDDGVYAYNYAKKQTSQQHMLPKSIYYSKFITFLRNYYLLNAKPHDVASITQSDSQVLGVYTGDQLPNEIGPTFSEEKYLSIVNYWSGILNDPSEHYDFFDDVIEDIHRMKEISAQNDSKFIVIIFPADFQMRKDIIETVAARAEKSVDKYDVTLPQRKLIEAFNKYDIEYIDLLRYWMHDPIASEYYIPRDSHLNSMGNMKVEENIYPEIQSMLSSHN